LLQDSKDPGTALAGKTPSMLFVFIMSNINTDLIHWYWYWYWYYL